MKGVGSLEPEDEEEEGKDEDEIKKIKVVQLKIADTFLQMSPNQKL